MHGKRSAALLVYRLVDGEELLVFLGHMGGPYWARKDEGGWSIPKGEFDPGEDDPLLVAKREFSEEIGLPAPSGEVLDLGTHVQPSGKVIVAFAVASERRLDFVSSNTFEMQWPRGSGRTQVFPEIDRAQWFPLATARRKVVRGQVPILDALADALRPTPLR